MSPNLYQDIPSDGRINANIRQGLQDMLVQTTAGVIVGGTIGLILSKRGSGYRKLYTCFGAGIGLGSAWTRTNMNLEQMLQPHIVHVQTNHHTSPATVAATTAPAKESPADGSAPTSGTM